MVGDNGNNTLFGHGGADTFLGKGGSDSIEAIDDEKDKSIDCGAGRRQGRQQGPGRSQPEELLAASGREPLLAEQRDEAAGPDLLAAQLAAATADRR